MRGRLFTLVAVVLLHSSCGGSDFDGNGGAGGTTSDGGGSGGTGGGGAGSGGTTAGSGGTSASGGTGGVSGAAGDGAAGAPSGGGTGGDSGADAADGDAGGGDSGGGDAGGGDSGGGDASGDATDAGVPISIVQATPTQTSTALVPMLTLQAPPVANNSIIVGITCISDHLGDCIIGTGGVTDNQGNTYTRILQGESIKSSSQGARGYIFITQGIGTPSGSFVISVDPDGSSTGQALVWGAIEVAGLASPPSLDASGITLVGASNSTTAATDTATTQPNELAVGVLSVRSNDTNILITPESTWVSHHVHQNNASGPPGHSMISKVLTATGIVSHTWTHDIPTRGAAGIIATFKGVTPN